MPAVRNLSDTKIMFVTDITEEQSDGIKQVIDVYDIETGRLVRFMDEENNLSNNVSLSWLDEDKLILLVSK